MGRHPFIPLQFNVHVNDNQGETHFPVSGSYSFLARLNQEGRVSKDEGSESEQSLLSEGESLVTGTVSLTGSPAFGASAGGAYWSSS